MEIIRTDRAGLAVEAAGLAADTPTRNSTLVQVVENSAADSFSAGWERDWAEGAVVQSVKDYWKTGGSAASRDFNPYKYINEAWDDDRKEKYGQYIADGLFDDVNSPAAVEVQASRIDRDIELEKKMVGNPWSAFAGILGANIFTTTNLVPLLNVGTKGRFLASAGKAALQFGALETAREAAVRNAHPLRSIEESILNVGFAAGIGGIIGGVLGKAAGRPAITAEQLELDGIRVVDADGNAEVIAAGGDLSAAATNNSTLRFWRADNVVGEQVGGKVINKVVKWLNRPSIVGRLMYSTSNEARKVALKLLDTGGILHKVREGFISAGPSAEDIYRQLAHMTHEAILTKAAENLRKVNIQLGKQGLGKVGNDEFANVLRDKMHGYWNTSDSDALVNQLGPERAKVVESAADDVKNLYSKINKMVEQKLVERGFIRDTIRFDSLHKKMADNREAIKQLQEQKKALKEAGRATRKAAADKAGRDAAKADTAKKVAEIDKQIDQVRADNESLRPEYESQLHRPEPLGENYGMAHLWQHNSIMNDRAAFEKFLIEEVLGTKVDTQWLMDTHNLLPEELEALRTADPEKYKAITEQYYGDEWYYKIDNLERAAESAEKELKSLELDMNDLLRHSKWIDAKSGQVKVSEAIAKRDAIGAKLRANRTARNLLLKEQKALREAATGARQITLDRLKNTAAPIDTNAKAADDLATMMAAGRKKAAAQRAQEDLISDLSPEEWVNFRASIDSKNMELQGIVDRADAAIAARLQETPAAAGTKVPKSNQVARNEGRLAEIEDDLRMLDKKYADDVANVQKMNDILQKYQARKATLKSLKETTKAAIRDLAQQRNITAKDARSLKAKLKSTMKRGAINDIARQITDNIVNGKGEGLSEFTDEWDALQTTGRVKERRLNLTPEQTRTAVTKGWLEDDFTTTVKAQYRQLAGHIALREAFDIGDHGMFKSWGEVVKRIDDDYDALRAAAPDEKAKNLITEEQNIVKKDILAARRRILGTEDVGLDRDSWMLFATRKARQANFLRFGLGFLPGSLTDIAMFSFNHALMPTIYKYGKVALKNALAKFPESEIGKLSRMMELSHASMVMAMGDDAMAAKGGIGARGSLKHTITSGMDKYGQKATEWIATLSGMPNWNSFWKSMAGFVMTEKLAALGRKGWDGLSEYERITLASVGLDEARLARLNKYMSKYSEVDDAGIVHPNTDQWIAAGREGQDAYADYMMAIQRDMRRSNLTVGMGDLPRLMDTWWGKTLMQFQTFAFVSANKYLTPMIQRLAVDGERINSMMNIAMLMATGTAAAYVKGQMRGENIFEKDGITLTREIVDRSGVLAYTAPYLEAMMKTMPLGEGSSRYRRMNAWEPLLGPSFSLAGDASRLLSSIDGDSSAAEVYRRAAVLAPGGTVLRIAGHVMGLSQ